LFRKILFKEIVDNDGWQTTNTSAFTKANLWALCA
jgi:hypothetical protein